MAFKDYGSYDAVGLAELVRNRQLTPKELLDEALARGLIFVIVSPIPGQEERNSDHLLEEGAAIRCNNLPVLAYKIDRLLDDPARLETMRANVRRLARPRAAYEIVARLLKQEDSYSRK